MMQQQFKSAKAPTITRENSKKIFMASEEKKMKQMQKMMTQPNQ
jgi:hypothetical protein